MKNSSNPEETLRKGSMPSGNDMEMPGNSQGTDDAPHAMSNTEALGRKPKPMAVRQASMDQACLVSARNAYLDSNGGRK